MNRDFEIRQLLRAYRGGLMSEAAFEEEMAQIEHESAAPDRPREEGFRALGQTYRSERDAVLSFLDELHATQMDAAIAFAKWSAVCRTRGLRTCLMMIAERKAYHARIIERRVHELGGVMHTTATDRGGKIVELLGNREIPEAQKFAAIAEMIREPQQAIAPIVEFAEALASDIETRQALRLIAEDEFSSASWLHDVASALLAGDGSAARVAR